MNKQIKATAISFLLFATGAVAQNTFPASGNVGIGTTSPSAPLSVTTAPLGTTAGSLAQSLVLGDNNLNFNYLAFQQIRFANGSDWTTAVTRIQNVTDVTPQGYMDFNPVYGQFGLAFGSGTSEFMRIANGGNVGIGTTNPGSPLEVNGNIAITGGSKGALLFADGSSLSTAAGLQSVSSGSLSSLGTVTTGIWNATPLTAAYLPADVDYIDQAQTISGQKSFMSNVGIGTVSPVSILHVASPMIPLATNGNPFGSGNLVIQALGGRSTTAGSALTFATAANTDGTNVWEQARIIATGDNSNSSNASGRLSLQTRFANNGTWDWNNNLVLTSAGSVGIGTTSPGAPLEVNGNIKLTQGSGSSIVFPDGTSLSSASSLLSGSSPSLGIGIGTASPLAPLDVAGTQTGQNPSGGHYLINYGLGGSLEDPNTGDIILLVPASTGSPVSGSQFAGIIQSNRGAVGGWNLNSQWYVSVQSAYTNNTGSITPLSGQQEYSTIPILITGVYNGQTYIGFRTPPGNSSSQWSLSGNWSNSQNSQNPILVASSAVSNVVPLVSYESLGSQISMTGIGSTGNMNGVGSSVNVGIGTTSPGATLEVNGSVKLTQGSGASMTFPDGTVQATAWNGTLVGGDYAESIDVLGDRAAYEPGDVIVIDDSETGKFHKSDKAYSKLVAGVFSTKPGLVGRRTTADRPDKEAEVPMAMMGIVPTKVSTENGPIERGDLLVSSSTPGYAMKGTDRDRLIGTVIGKALAPLKSDSGVIEVLVSLQ